MYQADATELIADHLLDTRSDEAIIEELNTYRPVTNEQNIWAFWHTGFDTMKPWTKRNVISWVRRHDASWNIRVLDRMEDSPSNINHYLDCGKFPGCFQDKAMTGPYAPAHSADMIRLLCLAEHGGVWLDVSILLFRTVDEICWTMLLDQTNTFDMAGFVIPDVHAGHQHQYGFMENWFIAARPRNAWILRWYQIFFAYWQEPGRRESKDVTGHNLFEHLDFGGYRHDMIDYLAQHVAFQRLRLLKDPTDGFDGPNYFTKHMYLLDAIKEAYYLPDQTRWQGQVALDLMNAPQIPGPYDKVSLNVARAGIKASAEEKQERVKRSEDSTIKPYCNGTVSHDHMNQFANSVVSHMISSTCLTKAVHGFKGDTQLSDLWNTPENKSADQLEGSCAAQLRWASIHSRQTRALHRLVVEDNVEESILEEPVVSSIMQSVVA